MASTQAEFETKDGKKQSGANRLYKILISESVYLIRKLRCKRLFNSPKNREPTSEIEIHNRWVKTRNPRLA